MYRREKKMLTCIQGKYLTDFQTEKKKVKKIHLGGYPSGKLFQTIEANISSVKLDFYTVYVWWHWSNSMVTVIRKKSGMENTFSFTGYLAVDFILT